MAIGLSIVAHGALVFGVVVLVRRSPMAQSVVRLMVLTEGPVEHPVPPTGPAPAPEKPVTPDLGVRARMLAHRTPSAAMPALRGGGPGNDPGGAEDRSAYGVLAPRYVTGHLWIPPLPLTPDEIASRLDVLVALGGLGSAGDGGGALDGQLIDSAITGLVQAYLDSVGAEPGADDQTLPSWTTQVGGLEFGIDRNWVYFGGLKIPAAVLALLPLPDVGSNYAQAKQYEYLMAARREIYYAAWMADTKAQFDQNVRQLRARKQRERDLARNQLVAPVLKDDSSSTKPKSTSGQ